MGPDGRIYAIGGKGNGNVGQNIPNTVEVYDPQTKQWSTGAPMPTARIGLAAVVGPDQRIYTIGGGDGGTALNTVEVYDPQTKQWSTGAPMPTARIGLAAVVGPDQRIYAIGGSWNGGVFNTNVFNTVEVYDPQTGKWSTGAPMPTARVDFAAVVGPDQRIYAIGGVNSSNFPNTVEVYDPQTGKWSTGAPMPTARVDFAAVVGPDGRIYAIGGFGGNGVLNFLNTVEVYDPQTGKWSTGAPMPTARSYFAAVVGTDHRIYAIGGWIGTALNTVEVYDPQTKQ